MAKIDVSSMELEERVVTINRVSKTVKGGRIFKFSALVVVGDGNGLVGFGVGKSGEVPDAIRKGIEDAKKNVIKVALRGTTIPHEITGKFGAGEVLLMPAPKGTGVIAGGPVRAVVEMAGIKNIRTKSLRSNNPCNVVRATMEGLTSLRTAEEVAALRGKTVKEIVMEGVQPIVDALAEYEEINQKFGLPEYYEDQDKIADYSLTEDGTYILKTKNGENVLVIKDGEASVTEADCPDGVCIRMGSISKTGENIVCLPHRLVVQIEEMN